MSLPSMLDAYLANALSGVHTSLVATVTAYDEKTHRATVKPSVRMLMDNGIQIELPELVDVPVVFPSSKAFDMEFPLDKGDGVLLVFQEQDISAWKNGDRNAAPSVSSRFGLDAAIAIPGCFPKPTKGKARIVVDSDGVITWEAKKIVFNEQVVFNDDVIARTDVYVGAGEGPGVSLNQHTHITPAGPSNAPSPLTPIPPEK